MMIPVLELLMLYISAVSCHLSALETRHEKSSEVIIPVLEHGKLHFGSDRVSVLNILIKISISPGASLGP